VDGLGGFASYKIQLDSNRSTLERFLTETTDRQVNVCKHTSTIVIIVIGTDRSPLFRKNSVDKEPFLEFSDELLSTCASQHRRLATDDNLIEECTLFTWTVSKKRSSHPRFHGGDTNNGPEVVLSPISHGLHIIYLT
jgi:hypothetical protein